MAGAPYHGYVGLRGWLQRVFDVPSAADRSGLTLEWADAVELPAPRDLARLIQACGVMPAGSVLYLEDGVHPPDLQRFLAENHVVNPTKLAPHTIWPRPTVHHVPVNAGTIDYLASYAKTVAGPEVCIHLAVYKDDRVLVQATDAPGDPVLINRHLPDDIIAAFARRLGFAREEVNPPR
jgi:hypothetical protein